LKFYFTGSYCFIEDGKYGRKFFVYLDWGGRVERIS
jgi:hypothetical protein